ncbi:hypothetical protein NMY22_g16332 [Coprinellus aureogranulatus]|nr:hypothetical protein NMY22_g16332 [Coprinellus aureogranulatus]
MAWKLDAGLSTPHYPHHTKVECSFKASFGLRSARLLGARGREGAGLRTNDIPIPEHLAQTSETPPNLPATHKRPSYARFEPYEGKHFRRVHEDTFEHSLRASANEHGQCLECAGYDQAPSPGTEECRHPRSRTRCQTREGDGCEREAMEEAKGGADEVWGTLGCASASSKVLAFDTLSSTYEWIPSPNRIPGLHVTRLGNADSESQLSRTRNSIPPRHPSLPNVARNELRWMDTQCGEPSVEEHYAAPQGRHIRVITDSKEHFPEETG